MIDDDGSLIIVPLAGFCQFSFGFDMLEEGGGVGGGGGGVGGYTSHPLILHKKY